MANEQEAVEAQQEGKAAAEGTADATKKAKEEQEGLVKRINASVDAANKLWEKMGHVSGVLSKSVQKAAAFSDSVAQTRTRLSLVVDDGGSVDALEEEIYRSAQRTGADYTATAQTVADLGQRAGDAFSGNSEAIQFVENLNKELALSGASQEQAGAATKQLVQAMEAGSLSGEGLNTVLGAAPSLVQTMADSMNVPVGTLMEMASQGQLTGEVVKNSLLGATDSINERFGALPVTFQQVWENITNEALYAFTPLLTKISEWLNSDSFAGLRTAVSDAISDLADAASGAFEILGGIVSFAAENWAFIAPLIYGVVAAIVAYKAATMVAAAAQAVLNGALYASPILKIALVVGGVVAAVLLLTQVLGSLGAAVAVLSAAVFVLNLVLFQNPIVAIISLIGILIGFLMNWVESVGGLQIAWMTCMDGLLWAWDMIKIGWLVLCDLFFSAIDNLKIGIFAAVVWVQDRLSQMAVAFQTVGVAIANFMGDMKVNVLTILQNMVNGAIDIINNFIEMLNNIPGVSIEAIEHVTFATKAAAENEAEKQARNAKLEQFKASEEADRQGRADRLAQMQADADANYAKRAQEINDALAKAEADSQQRKLEILMQQIANAAQTGADVGKDALLDLGGTGDYSNYAGNGGGAGGYGDYGGGYGADTALNTGNTAANTAKMADSLSSSEEELKLLREIAERQAINKFTTAEVKIDMTGMTNKIEGGEDIDGFLSEFTVKLEDALYATAEGVHV